jgi:peptide-methionine (S)-S-oxide reductase
MYTISLYLLSLFFTLLISQPMTISSSSDQTESIVLGAGCFWCTEAVFNRVQGITNVEVGYSGGHVENPSYKQVTTGTTGHVEVAKVDFNPEIISLEEVLEIFWHTHDPTTLNRQGADVGPMYRSVIFYANDDQKDIAEASLKKTDASDLWKDPIVTAIEPLSNYYVAEDYHQEYYEFNKTAGYCNYVIKPKLQKLFKYFSGRLKEDAGY